MLLQWGEKGVKGRVGRDCVLSPWDGVMCRMGVTVVPQCHLSPKALREGMLSRRMLLLLLPFPLTVHSLYTQPLQTLYPK